MSQRTESAVELIHDPRFLGYLVSDVDHPQTWHVVTPRSPQLGELVYCIHNRDPDPVIGIYRGVHIEGDRQVYKEEHLKIQGVVTTTISLPEIKTPSQETESCETSPVEP